MMARLRSAFPGMLWMARLDLSYTANFMNMLWRMVEPKYAANPVLARALDILFILHAYHEQNCSTNAMRSVGSSLADWQARSRLVTSSENSSQYPEAQQNHR